MGAYKQKIIMIKTQISLAQAADLAEIVAIYNSTIPSRQATADLQAVSVASRQTWFEAHQQPNRPIYIIKNQEDGKILAWASLSDYYPRPAYHITAEVSIYVHEAARGMGLGRELLAYLLQQSPNLGIKKMIAVIFSHNHASVKLFQSFGFETWGRLPEVCDLGEHTADIVILGKNIET